MNGKKTFSAARLGQDKDLANIKKEGENYDFVTVEEKHVSEEKINETQETLSALGEELKELNNSLEKAIKANESKEGLAGINIEDIKAKIEAKEKEIFTIMHDLANFTFLVEKDANGKDVLAIYNEESDTHHWEYVAGDPKQFVEDYELYLEDKLDIPGEENFDLELEINDDQNALKDLKSIVKSKNDTPKTSTNQTDIAEIDEKIVQGATFLEKRLIEQEKQGKKIPPMVALGLKLVSGIGGAIGSFLGVGNGMGKLGELAERFLPKDKYESWRGIEPEYPEDYAERLEEVGFDPETCLDTGLFPSDFEANKKDYLAKMGIANVVNEKKLRKQLDKKNPSKSKILRMITPTLKEISPKAEVPLKVLQANYLYYSVYKADNASILMNYPGISENINGKWEGGIATHSSDEYKYFPDINLGLLASAKNLELYGESESEQILALGESSDSEMLQNIMKNDLGMDIVIEEDKNVHEEESHDHEEGDEYTGE